MSQLQKITDEQMDAVGVVSAPDVLTGTPSENKNVFDKMVRQLIAPAYNRAVDAIDAINQTETGIQAAEAVRVAAENGRVQAESSRAAAETQRSQAEQARVQAENRREDQEIGYIAQAKDGALSAKSWAVGGTGTRAGEDTNNAEYWARQAAAAAGGGVMTFNGRTGTVVPQEGDYDSHMVKARPNRNLFPNWLWSGGGSQKGYGFFPINQRGKTSVNKPADYPILNDRWQCTTATIAEIVNEGITITADFQVGMLKSELEIGKTYTFSTVTADNLLGKITFELTGGISINTNVGPCNLVVYDDSTTWAFRVYGYGKTHVAVKLEEGDEQTLCYKDSNGKWILTETPDFSAELTKCQRDFVSGIVQTSILPWNGITFVGGTVFPAEMTKLPTIRIFSEKGGEENKVRDLNGTVQSPSVVEKYPTTKGLKAIRMDAALETTKSYTYYYEASTGM